MPFMAKKQTKKSKKRKKHCSGWRSGQASRWGAVVMVKPAEDRHSEILLGAEHQ